jgi:hypothetical protein
VLVGGTSKTKGFSMSQVKDGGPAFPHPTEGFYDDPERGIGFNVFTGMSLRDYFAGLAFTQLVHRREMTEGATYSKPELAVEAYAYADVLLKARKNQLVSDVE